jgi:hypothetical protein
MAWGRVYLKGFGYGHVCRCLWCGRRFMSKRSHATQCSNGCRQRLHHYRKEHGCDPTEPQAVPNVFARPGAPDAPSAA